MRLLNVQIEYYGPYFVTSILAIGRQSRIPVPTRLLTLPFNKITYKKLPIKVSF